MGYFFWDTLYIYVCAGLLRFVLPDIEVAIKGKRQLVIGAWSMPLDVLTQINTDSNSHSF